MRVVLASAFPERFNVNRSILADLVEAFGDLLGPDSVFHLDYAALDLQVRRLEPDLVLLVGSALLVQSDYREISLACRGCGAIFAFWTVEDPYEFDVRSKICRHADLVFSNDAWAVRFYDHRRVHHLPTAASPKKAQCLQGYGNRPIDVFFCGVGFRNRQVVISDALPVLERYRSLVLGENWPVNHGGIVFNRRIAEAEMSSYYMSATCVLNIGRDFHHANEHRALAAVTPGPRTFEAAMVGTVQIVWQPSAFMADYFTPGSEYIAVDDVEQLAEELARLLADKDGARTIASAAQRRALADHTYAARARSILSAAGLA